MTWPTVAITTTNVDAGTDSPATARADLLDALQKVNQMMAHVSAFAASLLDDANGATFRATLAAAASGANGDITALTALGTAVLNIGSGQIYKDSVGSVSIGTTANPNTRRLLVNGDGTGRAYVAVTDTSTTGNEVLLGMDQPTARSALQSSAFAFFISVAGLDRFKINTDGTLDTYVGSGLMKTFGCRAFGSMNGTGTPAFIGSGGNVASITDHGTGEYTVTFTNPMGTVGYAVVFACDSSVSRSANITITSKTVSDFRFLVANASAVLIDTALIDFAVML